MALLSATALTGCDWLGLESASATAARREAEGKAIGGACRHAGRAIEDCYLLNKRADKAAVFADESPDPTLADVTKHIYWEEDNRGPNTTSRGTIIFE